MGEIIIHALHMIIIINFIHGGMLTYRHVLMHFAAVWLHLQHQPVSDGYALISLDRCLSQADVNKLVNNELTSSHRESCTLKARKSSRSLSSGQSCTISQRCTKKTQGAWHNVKYLGRYLKRQPVSASQLRHYRSGAVFHHDYDHHSQQYRRQILSKEEMIRRYVSHMPVQLQLNKGEYRHKLPRWIFFANQGEFTADDYQEIMNKASALSLVSNAILYWNTSRISNIAKGLRENGEVIDDDVLAHISLPPYKHVLPNGTYFVNGEPYGTEPTEKSKTVGFCSNAPAGSISQLWLNIFLNEQLQFFQCLY